MQLTFIKVILECQSSTTGTSPSKRSTSWSWVSQCICVLWICATVSWSPPKRIEKNECLQNRAHCHLEVVDVPLPQQLVLASCSESKFWPFHPTCLRCEVRLQKVPLLSGKKMKANVKNSLVHRLVSLYTVSMIWSNYYIVCTHYMAGSIPLKTIRDAASN